MSYWARAAEFFERELNDQGYVSPSDLGLYERVDSAAAALGCIERFYSRYHSMRCVNDKLVVRLQSPLPPQRISTLEQDFTDLLRPGGRIRLSGPLPAEADQPHLAHLPRLVIDFSRRDFARLRRLIDAVNE